MICRVCGVEKKNAEFSRNKNMKDGRAKICKVCERARAKEYYQKNRKRLIAKHAEWIKNNPERHREIVYNWLIKNGKIKNPGIIKDGRKNEQGKDV